jgi:hypothetical protein
MKTLSYLVAFTVGICGPVFTELPVSAGVADFTGACELFVN